MTGPRIAVVGAGWAGIAAAVACVEAGARVRVFESARVAGGRARSVTVDGPDGQPLVLDNGQHILIGAYSETLDLMRRVGVAPADALLRLPLAVRYPDGAGLVLPDWPAPWDALAGMLRAPGWGLGDRASLLRHAALWQLRGFRCDAGATVADLCARLAPRVRADLIDPLCVAALNTPADRASGTVFLRVLRDSLFGRGWGDWGASNLLLPRVPLGQLLPEAALAWLRRHGAEVVTGHRVATLVPSERRWLLDGLPFDHVVLACPPWEAARLTDTAGAGASAWRAQAQGLGFEAIATVYAQAAHSLPAPMLALRHTPQAPAQFAFDRGQLGGPAGLLAFVVSASGRERETVEAQVVAQAAHLGWPVKLLRTVVEKRATFACLPGLQRPGTAISPGLWACGDYVEGPYPATLEGAVRSGLDVAARVSAAAPPAR